jgi:hypothetical protein
MKQKSFFWKILVIGAICLLLLPSIQGSLANDPCPKIKHVEDDVSDVEPLGTTHFSNCVVWIYGSCKTVIGALTWIFGIFCPLFKKHLNIQATGQEGESLNVIVTQDGLGTYFDQENIRIELSGTTGILYWYGKSLIFEGDQIFTRCKADDCWITI